MGADSVHPPGVEGTCRSTGGVNMFDVFLCCSRLAQGIKGVEIVSDSELATHDPVSLTFHPSLASLKALTFRRPPPLPTSRPAGPCPEPPFEWG
eukprot:5073322-Pyramimonas_sp.AAC.1